MKTMIKKRGNGAFVRIPASVMQAAKLALGLPVDVREENGRVIIEPIRPAVLSLNKLVNAITPENLHRAADYGQPKGGEIW